jgi:starvation-inducible DNA-binding protein
MAMSSPTADPPIFDTRHDLDPDTRAGVIEHLNRSLADTTDLQTQVKHAHWNVKGPQFQPLHQLFDEQAAILAAHADMLAERTTALGGYAPGTARQAVESSRLPEFPVDAVDGMDCLEALAERFAAHAEHLRAGIEATEAAGDVDSADLYTELSREIDKQLWFLEAHLQGPDLPGRIGEPVGADD